MKRQRAASLMLVVVCFLFESSCQKERTIKVTCGPTDAEAVSADFGSPNVAGISIGLLNSHQFSPGMLLELFPPAGQDQFGHGDVPYVVKVDDANDFAPLQPEATISKVVSANFNVQMDADVQQAAAQMSIDIKSMIKNDTKLTATNAQRKTLRDPIGLLNGDSKAVDRIKGHPDNRYVIISAVSLGDAVNLSYQASTSVSSDVNVIKFGKFKLDINWDCSDIAQINSNASAAPAHRTAILFFYVPVTYKDGKIDTDARPLDLTKYHLANAFEAR